MKSDPPCYSLPRAADHWHHMQAQGPYPPTCCCHLEGRCPSTHSAPEPCLSSSLPVASSRHLYCTMLHHNTSTYRQTRWMNISVFSDVILAHSVLRLSSFRWWDNWWIGRKQSWPGSRKAMRILGQDSHCPGQDFNQASTKHQIQSIAARPTYSPNWEGCARKELWPNHGSDPVFVKRNWVKPWKDSVRIASVPVETSAEHLPDPSL